jgi:hypothetical protein
MTSKLVSDDVSGSDKSRRGLPKYDSNPFIAGALVNSKPGMRKISNTDGSQMMVVNGGTGEIMAPAGFWHAQEVDKTAFVKLYINGVKAFKDLTGAGTKVFEVLYVEVQKFPGRDTVYMGFHAIDKEIHPMSKATFMRGMRELVDKGFLAETRSAGLYFLNPDYLWNGDRLAFVKEYRVKPTGGTLNDQAKRDALEAQGQQRLEV